MKKYTIQPGRHDFKPADSFALSAPWCREVTYRVKFAEDCNYILPGEEQRDWNKGGGFTFSLFSNTKNAAMWAWRWNPVQQRIQLCAYWHRDGKAYFAENTDDNLPFAVRLGQEFIVRVYKQGVTWFVSFKTYDGFKTVETTVRGNPVRPIGLWFGGNNLATKAMTVWIEKNGKLPTPTPANDAAVAAALRRDFNNLRGDMLRTFGIDIKDQL